MQHISNAVDLVRSVNEEFGEMELSRLSGVPYTTIRSLAGKGFRSKSIETMERLEAAAAAKRSVPDGVMPPASQTEASEKTEICGADFRRATSEIGGAA